MARLITVSAVALIALLVTASASAHTLSNRRAVQNTRAVAAQIAELAAQDGLTMSDVRVGPCTRRSAHAITCQLHFTLQPAAPRAALNLSCRVNVGTRCRTHRCRRVTTTVGRPQCNSQ